jgi:hypothetical protein
MLVMIDHQGHDIGRLAIRQPGLSSHNPGCRSFAGLPKLRQRVVSFGSAS